MLIEFCKSKLAHCRVTDAQLHYEGSITIDSDLIRAAGLVPNEKVHILNMNTGSRIETYVIAGKPGSGEICLNGPAARHGYVGDKIIVLSYAFATPDEVKANPMKVVYVDEQNRIKK